MPQPQEAVTFGLLILNWAPISSSTKSISEPRTKPSEIGSTTTLRAVALDHEVVRRTVLHQVEAVLEARAAAALDADAHQRRVLGPQNLRQSAGRRARSR